MTALFLLKIEKHAVAGKLTLNDVPIRVWTDGTDFETTDPVNQWIRPGENRLTAVLDRPPGESEGLPRLAATLNLTEPSEDGTTVTRPLAQLTLPPVSPVGLPVWPLTVTVTFEPETPPPSDVWPRLVPLEPGDELRDEALELIARLHAAFQTKDLDQLSLLLRVKALDMTACYGLPTEQAPAEQVEFFSALMQRSTWLMAPLDPDKIELHLVGDGGLLWPTGPDRAPVLRSSREVPGPALDVPLYLARRDGVLTVVR